MKIRCPWLNLKNPLYVRYHDKEWGRPVHNDRLHFEMLILEGAQAGLSWETILKKRAHYKKVYANFDPRKVAKFSAAKRRALLKDAGIVRNRLKVNASVENARAFLRVQKEFGSFDKYVWSFVGNKPIVRRPKTLKDYRVRSNESDLLSKELKKRGFRFVGSTIIYAYLQAVGLINDHSTKCHCRGR